MNRVPDKYYHIDGSAIMERQHTPTTNANTIIDGNEDHMTNTDGTLFDGHRYEVCKYLPVVIW